MRLGKRLRLIRKRVRQRSRSLRHPQRWPRRAFFRVAGRYAPFMAAETEHGVVLLSTGDTSFASRLFEHGHRKEFRTLDQALRSLREAGRPAPAGVFVDAGAHVGTTTLGALAAGFEHVLSVEPTPESCRLLRANAALNGLHDRVTVVEAALADTVGAATLDLGKGSAVKNRLAGAAGARGASLTVAQTTLDELVATGKLDPDAVGMLWIDVEGEEPRVLLGASKLLERGVPVVAEVNPKYGDSDVAARMLAALERHYSHVLDLGSLSTGELQPVAELVSVAERYRAGHKFTDVLIVRL